MTEFRDATRDDLPALVALLADDDLGATREDPGPPVPAAYVAAFEAIAADPHQHLIVAERNGALAGFLQLMFLPHLSRGGAWRAQIEGVRVAREARGSGLGAALVEHAVQLARAHGCRLAQLTTDKQRPDALRFYERLGFRATHEGLKMALDGAREAT